MNHGEKRNFKERIREEMVIDSTHILEKNFERVKQLIKITEDGKVDIRVRNKLNGKDKVLLYLIGKLYAKEGEYADTEEVDNKELMKELNIPEGSLLPWLKNLRDANRVRQTKKGRYVLHSIPIKSVESILEEIEER